LKRDSLESQVRAHWPSVKINGNRKSRLPHNSSLTFPGLEADALLANLPDIMLSTGSACQSGALEPSQVLQAIGLSVSEAGCTFRVGIWRTTTATEIEIASIQIVKAVRRVE